MTGVELAPRLAALPSVRFCSRELCREGTSTLEKPCWGCADLGRRRLDDCFVPGGGERFEGDRFMPDDGEVGEVRTGGGR